MTSYRIEHQTTYTYDSDVTGSYGLFHLRPRDLDWQHCVAHEISVDPEPADLFRHFDLYGNTKSYFHVVRPHTTLKITAISVVEVARQDLDPDALAVPWEQARPGQRPDQPDAWEATDFTYKSGATTTSTKVSELLTDMRGVCQDFSHFMVSGLRSLGLAGRYVSGYLATRPPPGKPRLVGADASHAWVGCWIPGAGWLYLDPTNNRLADESHATVAWGRDYGDVPPVKGVIFSEAKKSQLKVSVDMLVI